MPTCDAAQVLARAIRVGLGVGLCLVLSACAGAGCAVARSALLSKDELRAALGPALPSSTDVVLVGAGDIAACGSDGAERSARLVEVMLESASPKSRAFTAGDNVYPTGAPEDFRDCYLPTWGRFLKDTLPVAGNHDWMTPEAAGYFATFGPAAGSPKAPWRAVSVGSWRVILLESNCDDVGGCDEGSPQHAWLEAELAGTPSRCTLAIWHHPLASSGPHGPDARTRALWTTLDRAGAELVIAGHDHIYERFGPLSADGAKADAGLRSFVIGTGGAGAYAINAIPHAGSEVRLSGEPAVLALFLKDGGYRWRAIGASGRVLDEGEASCR
jgi:acid phosphatase type 7